MQKYSCYMIIVISYLHNISICFDALILQDYLTRIVWSWEPELGVKDIFGGIPTLPSLSISENAYRVLFTNASVNTCNNNSYRIVEVK